jgi:hypothetical protein
VIWGAPGTLEFKTADFIRNLPCSVSRMSDARYRVIALFFNSGAPTQIPSVTPLERELSAQLALPNDVLGEP